MTSAQLQYTRRTEFLDDRFAYTFRIIRGNTTHFVVPSTFTTLSAAMEAARLAHNIKRTDHIQYFAIDRQYVDQYGRAKIEFEYSHQPYWLKA